MQGKPKSIRAIRKLKKREPKLVEGVKQTLFIKGNKSSESVSALMKDFRSLRRVHCTMYSRRHDMHPFQSTTQLQSVCHKTDTSLFFFGSHSKKRPNNIVIGRTYQHKVLDMVEFGLINSTSIQDLVGALEVPYLSQPFVVFQGDLWQSDPEFKKMKNLLNDFFLMNNKPKGIQIDKVLKVVVCLSVTEDKKIFLNIFQVNVQGGTKILEQQGKLIIEQLGPNAQLILRRQRWATDQQFKKATHVPKPKKKKQNKNIRYDALGNKRGKLYMDRQNLKVMPTKRRKLISKGQKREAGQIIGHTKNEDQFAQ